MPFSRRIGLTMSACSTSGITIARRSAAMRPAKPRPTGIETPCSTSSSIPLAARAVRSSPFSSSIRIAAVSVFSASVRRSSSAVSMSSSDRYASAASVIRWSASRRRRASALLREQVRVVDRDRGTVGGELEQLPVVLGELARGQAADVQDAERPAFDHERDAEQRADALLAQDRVQDIGVVDVRDLDRAPLGDDAAREAAAHGQPRALVELLLEPLGGARDQHLAARLEQQDRRGVAVQDLGDAVEQRGQELVLGQIRQRGVRHALERLELAAHRPIIWRPQVS